MLGQCLSQHTLPRSSLASVTVLVMIKCKILQSHAESDDYVSSTYRYVWPILFVCGSYDNGYFTRLHFFIHHCTIFRTIGKGNFLRGGGKFGKPGIKTKGQLKCFFSGNWSNIKIQLSNLVKLWLIVRSLPFHCNVVR